MVTGAVVILCLLPASIACLYYAIGAILGRFPRRMGLHTPTLHIAILIPAHDEELALPKALASIAASDYPSELVTVRVVADHCTDGTETLARQFGADCTVRQDSLNRGKGYALAEGFAVLVPSRPGAVLILDADCRISSGLLKRLDAECAVGAKVVQAAVVSTCAPGNPVSIVAAIGASFDNRMAAAGDRLGRFVPLRGTGMLFTRDILERFPWTQFGLAEDAEYGSTLRRQGVPIRFVAGESVTCEAPPHLKAFLGQRRRWGASLRVPQAPWPMRWLVSKPLILAHLLITAITVVIVAPEGWLAIWLLVLMGLTAAIYTDAMLTVGVRWPGFRSFWLIGRMAALSLGSLWAREAPWQRTTR
jgi:1,2-diacylglycerol 3-beta-glucosyltransferase